MSVKTATILTMMCLTFSLYAQPELESKAKSEMAYFSAMHSSFPKRSQAAEIDMIYARLKMEPDMQNGEIRSASVTYAFKTLNDINALEFDLRKDLTVDSIVYNSDKMLYTHGNDHIIKVSFGTLIPGGKIDSLSIYYHGMPDMSTRSYSRNVNASGPNISTLSQPYGAPYWWPGRDNLADKIDSIDVILSVDTPYIAVSNGVLQYIKPVGAKRTFVYKHRYPIANYLVAVAFSRYITYTQKAYLNSLLGDMDIVNYVFPHNNIADVKDQTFKTVDIIRLYDSLFGPYPFREEQYGHCQFSWSGGMEHQTMSFMTNFNYDLIAHELAHQWFGDKVTCGSWKDIWLNEGFATYSNLLCYDFTGKRDVWMNQLKKNKSDVMSQPGGSVYAYDTTDVNKLFAYRTTYQKGAMVLHQLRWLVGDKAFFEAIRNYLEDADLAYDFAVQKDLQAYMEASSGMDLNDYFKDWIYGEGYPIYKITWEQNGRDVIIDIEQSNSLNSSDTFNVPLPLLLKGYNRDSMIHVPIGSTHVKYTIPLDFIVRKLEFDPDEWIIAKSEIRFPLVSGKLVKIFPNPFTDRIYIASDYMDIDSWEIYDWLGRMVDNSNSDTVITTGSIEQIDMGALASGMYILKVTGNSGKVNELIIKK